MSLKTKDSKLRAQSEDFLQVFDAEWSKRMSTQCFKKLYDDKLDKEQTIPLTSDLIKLSSYLNKEIKCKLEAKNKIDADEWCELAKLTLCKLINLTKRRAGEVGKMKLKDYHQRPTWDIHKTDEIFSSLSEFEKKLANKLDLIKIKGKRGRHVPLILTPDVSKAMSILVKNREFINKENNFCFANRGDYYLRPWDVMKEMCIRVKVENIQTMTSTKMRKYVATTSQILNLQNEELGILASHLGHDINVHRKYYRLQSSTLELAKVSKLLIAIESGVAHKFAGKTLNDIETPYTSQTTEETDLPGSSRDTKEDELSIQRRCSRSPIVNREDSPNYRSRSSSSDINELPSQFPNPTKKKSNAAKPWDMHVKAEAFKSFSVELRLKKAPGKIKCEEFMAKIKLNRKWTDVKNLIKMNIINQH